MSNNISKKDKNKKRILFLSPLPPPHYGSAMSSEMCLEILKKSAKFKLENIKLNYSKEMSDVGKINLDKIKGIFRVKKQIKKSLKKFKPSLVYFVPATSGLGLMRDCLFTRKIKKTIGKEKIVFHVRSRTIKNRVNNFFYKKMFSGGRAIVLGEQLKKDVSDFIKEKEISVLPNAIKNEITEKNFNNIMEQRKKEKQYINLLFLSNMAESKGWFKLLQSCNILKKKKIKFKCNFIGSFPSKKEKLKFFNYIKNNNLSESINYFGRKTGKEKNKVLENSDILVFPTEYPLETFGRVVIEGMMFGLPVIANGIATIPTTIQHNKTGFVLKENDGKEIANYIEKLYNNKKLRISMGKQGRGRFLENYSLDKYKDKFLRALDNYFFSNKKN